MNCGWCHGSKECVAGDAQGPWFQTSACGEWSHNESNLCLGKASDGAILGVRIGVGIAIGVITILSVVGCYVVIKRPSNAPGRDGYAEIQTMEARD
jgi:hypothetical protein